MNWSDLSRDQKGVTVTTVLTTLMHLAFSVTWFGEEVTPLDLDLGFLFIINGIGYIVILAGLYFLTQTEDKTNLFRLLLLIWTLGSIIGWAIYHPEDTLLDSSISNKIVEVILLVFLYLDYQEASSSAT